MLGLQMKDEAGDGIREPPHGPAKGARTVGKPQGQTEDRSCQIYKSAEPIY